MVDNPNRTCVPQQKRLTLTLTKTSFYHACAFQLGSCSFVGRTFLSFTVTRIGTPQFASIVCSTDLLRWEVWLVLVAGCAVKIITECHSATAAGCFYSRKNARDLERLPKVSFCWILNESDSTWNVTVSARQNLCKTHEKEREKRGGTKHHRAF